MTEQSSGPRHAATQTEHPARATVRTLFAVLIALAAGAPILIQASGADGNIVGVAAVLAVAGGITRVMALPWTEDFLGRFLPWLAAAPKAQG